MRVFGFLSAAALCAAVACAPVDEAERSETITQTVTVQEIDKANRRFVVSGEGRRTTLRATEAVQNFDQLNVGDTIKLEYRESVAVAMADPEDTGETLATSAVFTPQAGESPGLLAGEVVTSVVEFVSYSLTSNTAQVRTQDGNLLTVAVQPEMRRFAQSREAGDRILVGITQALAISVEPVS